MRRSHLRRSSDYAILGVLAQGGAMSGYDVRNYINASIAQFWSESFGQIYPTLSRLSRQKLVRSLRDPMSSRARRIFEITPAGRAVLREWLAQPPEPERVRSEVILKTFLGDQAEPGVAQQHLEQVALAMEARVRLLESIEDQVRLVDAASASLGYSIASIRAGIHLSRARATWAREAIELIAKIHRRSE